MSLFHVQMHNNVDKILSQGEANLKFIFFMMHQLDNVTPSFSSMKKFHLSGFIPHHRYTIIIHAFSCNTYFEKLHYSCFSDSITALLIYIPFYVNSPKEIVRNCIGNPKIAAAISRYPTIQQDTVKYVCGKTCAHPFVYLIHTLFREMFHGQRWLQDTRFFSPMADTSAGNLFLYDFVTFNFGPHLKFGHIPSILFQGFKYIYYF